MRALGERRLREWFSPAYGALVMERLSEADRDGFLRRLAANQRADRLARRLRPSQLFPSISPGLDARLIRDGRDIDVACLEALAAVPRIEQGAFYDRYRVDPVEAARWVAAPAWKRPLLAGDAEDRLIWKLFTVMRLKVDWCARFSEKGLAEEGYQLAQLAGLLASVKDMRRLGMVLSMYGGTLREGGDPGDVMHPPWPTDFGGGRP